MRLTIGEMQQPHLILKEFFSAYHLTDIRECLKEWLSAALRKDDVVSIDYLYLHDSIERLIEAAWILNSKKKERQSKRKKR